MVTLPNNGDVKLTKEYDNLRNQLVEFTLLFTFLFGAYMISLGIARLISPE